jgi:hypothetical protein
MANTHDNDERLGSLELVQDPIVAQAYSPHTGSPGLKFFNTWRPRILSEGIDCSLRAFEDIIRQVAQVTLCPGGEFDSVTRHPALYKPRSFFTCSQGTRPGSWRALRACSMSCRSSNCSRNSASSAGTSAAIRDLPRLTKMRSPSRSTRARSISQRSLASRISNSLVSRKAAFVWRSRASRCSISDRSFLTLAATERPFLLADRAINGF